MEKLQRAFFTTLLQFPVILWLFLGISIYRLNDLIFSDIWNMILLSFMVYLTFFVAYNIKKYNNHRFKIYLLIPLSFVVMMLVEKSWISQLGLFFTYMIFMTYLLRETRFEVFYKNLESSEVKHLSYFNSKKKAKLVIKNSIERSLKKLVLDIEEESELIKIYLKNRQFSYKINQKEFDDTSYINTIAPVIYRTKLQNIIDGGFKKTQDKKILKMLEDIQESEVVEVNSLQNSIEIVYIKDAQKKYLSIKDSYYANSQAGIGSYFEFSNKQLDNSFCKKEYINEKKNFKEYEYLKEEHQLLKDMYFIINLFYLEDISKLNKVAKYVIIYKTKEGSTNAVEIFFNTVEILTKKYENIFKFYTRILEDELRTQLEYSYCDKLFSPIKYFDTLDKQTNSLKREKIGNNDYDFPCVSFGKKIFFGFDEQGGISAYNLASTTHEYQLINHDTYSYFTNKERENFHLFLSIAQLYLNAIFINKKFENTLVLDTNEYLENHKKIERFKKNLDKTQWREDHYYDNGEQGYYPTKFAYIYFIKKQRNKRFVVLEETDWIDTKLTIKYNDDIKSELEIIL